MPSPNKVKKNLIKIVKLKKNNHKSLNKQTQKTQAKSMESGVTT